jgi:hypothetical protein
MLTAIISFVAGALAHKWLAGKFKAEGLKDPLEGLD